MSGLLTWLAAGHAAETEFFVGATTELALDPFQDDNGGGGGTIGADVGFAHQGDRPGAAWELSGSAAALEILSENRIEGRGFGGAVGHIELGDTRRALDVDAGFDVDSMKLDVIPDQPVEPLAVEGALTLHPSLQGERGAGILGELELSTLDLREGKVPFVQERSAGASLELAAPRFVSLGLEGRASRVEVAPFISPIANRQTRLVAAALGLRPVEKEWYELRLDLGAAVELDSQIAYPELAVAMAWRAPWLQTWAGFGVDFSTPWYADWQWSFYWERAFQFSMGLGPYARGRFRQDVIRTPNDPGGTIGGGLLGTTDLTIGWERGRFGLEGYWRNKTSVPRGFFGTAELQFDESVDTRWGTRVSWTF